MIERVIDRDDIMYCCGAFAIDDEELCKIVRVEGNSDAVIGLSKDLTVTLLEKHEPSIRQLT
jgi:predicted house-cleaning NTP pyrophosphatase (Maf/HAM1 superfamily)